MDSKTTEVIYIAEKVGPLHRGLVIDQRTQVALARTGTYVSAETAKSAAASMWRAKLAGSSYSVLHVTATSEQAVHTFSASSLTDAAREAIQPKHYKPWCATVLIDNVSGDRYSIRDCEAVVKQAVECAA